ncbi:unnamed protein product [Nezara viridula]|uniref:Uncharacterized protein n=1 Tax=Nezara viridula TaxID=85310 RepID=A0A9P0E686_NEZVI|nr:unnamed protein product [Nezara viridula]
MAELPGSPLHQEGQRDLYSLLRSPGKLLKKQLEWNVIREELTGLRRNAKETHKSIDGSLSQKKGGGESAA